MPSIFTRNLPDATHQAFKLQAAQHGRSFEAEIRFILEAAVAPRVGLGCALAEIGRSLRGADWDAVLDAKRDPRPVKSADFE